MYKSSTHLGCSKYALSPASSRSDYSLSRFAAIAISMLLAASSALSAQPHPALPAQAAVADQQPLWPGVSYDEAIPSHDDVLGYRAGTKISSHAQIRQYFEALAQAAPQRMRLFDYAESWEGRKLFYAVIGSKQLISKLETIQQQIQAVANPAGKTTVELDQLPGTVWLSYGVHGNEISSPEAAMVSAWHLLAARDDAMVDNILDSTLVFINPLQNPDGRDRFVHAFRQASGPFPDPSRYAAEHDEPWPSGRVNHYLFDLNRDWLAIPQPETAGHIQAVLQWYPLAFVDAHEMGSDQTYFFAPEAIPYNPLLVTSQRESLQMFGRNNARWFDRYGFDYFTREIFDAFYPGYGASWPSYYGGIAMTYEQGSARGLVVRRRSGDLLSYRESLRHHFVASLATVQTVAENRKKLWQNFADYRRSAIAGNNVGGDDDNNGPASFIIPAQTDRGGAHDLGQLLRRHGADVYHSTESFSACGTRYQAGSQVINLNQPEHRLLRVLLDQQVSMDQDFIASQLERQQRGLADEIYDVTAWSLPLMFNLDVQPCAGTVNTSNMRLLQTDSFHRQTTLAEAEFGYIIHGQDRRTTQAMAELLKRGIKVQSSHLPITIEGTQYPSGSLVIPRAGNADDLHAKLLALTALLPDVQIETLDSSWVTDGPSIGSGRTATLVTPNVALVWDTPTDGYSPGATRFVLERQFSYPVTPIRTATLGRAQLDDFDVLILPDSRGPGYASVFDAATSVAIKGWIERGGVLVTLAAATRWASHEDVALLATSAESKASADADNQDEDQSAASASIIESAQDYQQAIEPDQQAPTSTSGVLVQALVDREHWLSAGVADSVNVLVRGDTILEPLQLDEGDNVVRYAAKDALLQSGYLWPDNAPQLAWKPFVLLQRHGRGMVIGFSEDPNVRAYLRRSSDLFINAVLRAPAYSGKLR